MDIPPHAHAPSSSGLEMAESAADCEFTKQHVGAGAQLQGGG